MEILINWWAVVVGAVALHVMGFIWYGPLFGKTYGSIIGMPGPKEMSPEANKEFQNKMWPLYILNFVLGLLTSGVLAYFIGIFLNGNTPFASAICMALFIFLGFMLPLIAGNSIWSGKPKEQALKLFWINAGYYLLSFIVLTIILSNWQ